jgi:hypothetical protein
LLTAKTVSCCEISNRQFQIDAQEANHERNEPREKIEQEQTEATERRQLFYRNHRRAVSALWRVEKAERRKELSVENW